eukprot:810362-Prorocentrum_minimum.AAC.2
MIGLHEGFRALEGVRTPLHYAAKHGHAAAADALCNQLDSVDIDAQDEVRFRLMWSRRILCHDDGVSINVMGCSLQPSGLYY